MSRHKQTLTKLLSGASDTNIRFDDLCNLLLELGFSLDTRGSHHIFRREGIRELLNLQRQGNLAKPYQARQVRGVITGYRLARDTDDQETVTEDNADDQ